MADKTVRIVVAAHKPYPMPADDIYLPLQVGAALKKDEEGRPLRFGYAADDTGENISELNPGFSELTALYWAWKNLREDYIGLVHYRRHFGFGRRKCRRVEDALKGRELIPLLKRYAVFVPKKRWYVIETLYSHYAHTHYAGHLDITREILKMTAPAYLASFDRVMKQRWGYMFNMAIMRRDVLDRYAAWLFPILFALLKRLSADKDTSELDAYQGRLYGRVSELLLNVWLDFEIREGRLLRGKILELPYFNTEKTNYLKKGGAFLRARLFHKRYGGSF